MEDIDFTFGIITDGKNDQRLQQIIETIRNQKIPRYEIIIIGNSNINGADIATIKFDESIKNKWITRKKNLIAQQANYENLVILHDYIYFTDDWYAGFKKYIRENGDFDVISNKILNINNKRFRDWCLFPEFLKGEYGVKAHPRCEEIISSGCLLPYDFKSKQNINDYIYYSGAYFIIKRSVFLKFPFDENLVWKQSEDVHWSNTLSKNSIIFKFNPYSTVKLLKKKNSPFWQKEINQKLLYSCFENQ